MRIRKYLPAAALMLALLQHSGAAQTSLSARPPAPPERWTALIGEYGPARQIVHVLEKEGRLWVLSPKQDYCPALETKNNRFKFPSGGCRAGEDLEFKRGPIKP